MRKIAILIATLCIGIGIRVDSAYGGAICNPGDDPTSCLPTTTVPDTTSGEPELDVNVYSPQSNYNSVSITVTGRWVGTIKSNTTVDYSYTIYIDVATGRDGTIGAPSRWKDVYGNGSFSRFDKTKSLLATSYQCDTTPGVLTQVTVTATLTAVGNKVTDKQSTICN